MSATRRAKQVSTAQLHMGSLSLQAICEGDISHPNTSCENSKLDQHTASHITQLHQITQFPKVGPLLGPQKITSACIFLLRSWASGVWIQRIGLQGSLFLKQKATLSVMSHIDERFFPSVEVGSLSYFWWGMMSFYTSKRWFSRRISEPSTGCRTKPLSGQLSNVNLPGEVNDGLLSW